MSALRLQNANLAEPARAHGLEFVVVFGSTTRGRRAPRDFDLAVMPQVHAQRPDRLALLGDLCESLGRADVDLVWLPTASWVLASEVARSGQVLYEERPGLFGSFRRASHWRSVDSDVWRHRKRAYLDRFLRGELHMDRDLVTEKLLQMTNYLQELELVLDRPQDEFYTNPLLHRTAERTLELLVECGARINTEVGESRGIPPSDYYSSFFALQGDLDGELLRRLADCARLRNLLVHQYEKVGLEEVYATVRDTLPLWRDYVAGVRDLLD